MNLIVKMPLRVYTGFLSKCPATSREYAVLKKAVLEPNGSGEIEVHILCDGLDAEVLREGARRFYRTGVTYIEDAFTAIERAAIQTKLRIEFRELVNESYRDIIKKSVIEQLGNTMRDGYFVDCRCEEIRVDIYGVSPLDHVYSASFGCLCGCKRKPLENLQMRAMQTNARTPERWQFVSRWS